MGEPVPEPVLSNRVLRRVAVRAVIVQGERILLLRSHGGDVKFPGGGVESGEGHEEALTREVREETGFTVTRVDQLLTVVTESHADIFDETQQFEMTSFYYSVEVGPQEVDPEPTASEQAAGLSPVWLTRSEAISANADATRRGAAMPWVGRETRVLESLAPV